MNASVSGQALLLTILVIILMSIQFQIPTISSPTTSLPYNNKYLEFIKKSCNDTLYPNLCYKSLATHANEIKTDQKLLVLVSLNVTLQSTKSTSRFFRNMATDPGSMAREAAAAADCVEEVGDAVDELKRSIEDIRRIDKSSNFREVISDVQTWVSAALTDDSTCADGFSKIGKTADPIVVKNLRIQIERIAHLTSNALAFINRYASS